MAIRDFTALRRLAVEEALYGGTLLVVRDDQSRAAAGRRGEAAGLEHARGRRAAGSIAENSPSSVGPLMSVRIALGAVHETQGRRKNVRGDISLPLIALRIRCWRAARSRSFSAGLQSFLRTRASPRACSPSRWLVPLCRSIVVAAVAVAAVELGAHAALGGRSRRPARR